jgi:hypothetical protein
LHQALARQAYPEYMQCRVMQQEAGVCSSECREKTREREAGKRERERQRESEKERERGEKEREE